MRSGGANGGIRWLLVIALSSCARFGYEPPADDPFGGLTPVSGPNDQLWDASSAGDARADFVPERGELGGDRFDQRPARQRLRRFDSGGTTPVNPTPEDGGTTPPGGACQLLGTEQVVSGFDSSPAGVQARGPGNPTLNWTNAVGNPAPGALDFSDPTGAGGEVFYNGPIGDLRTRGVSLNIQFASGASVRARMFAESGPLQRRAVGTYTSPAVGQWSCAHFDPGAPASAESGFDAADIVGLGIELEGTGSVRVYLDQIAY